MAFLDILIRSLLQWASNCIVSYSVKTKHLGKYAHRGFCRFRDDTAADIASSRSNAASPIARVTRSREARVTDLPDKTPRRAAFLSDQPSIHCRAAFLSDQRRIARRCCQIMTYSVSHTLCTSFYFHAAFRKKTSRENKSTKEVRV